MVSANKRGKKCGKDFYPDKKLGLFYSNASNWCQFLHLNPINLGGYIVFQHHWKVHRKKILGQYGVWKAFLMFLAVSVPIWSFNVGPFSSCFLSVKLTGIDMYSTPCKMLFKILLMYWNFPLQPTPSAYLEHFFIDTQIYRCI